MVRPVGALPALVTLRVRDALKRALSFGTEHALYVFVPPQSQRASAWAISREAADPDRIAFATMLRNERLNCG